LPAMRTSPSADTAAEPSNIAPRVPSPVGVADRGGCYGLEDAHHPWLSSYPCYLSMRDPDQGGGSGAWTSLAVAASIPGRGGVSPRPSPPGRGSGRHRSSIPRGRRAPWLISAPRRAPVTWLVGTGAPLKGLPPLICFGPAGTRTPAPVAAREPAAISKTGEAATREERLIRWPAPGRRPPGPSACGSSASWTSDRPTGRPGWARGARGPGRNGRNRGRCVWPPTSSPRTAPGRLRSPAKGNSAPATCVEGGGGRTPPKGCPQGRPSRVGRSTRSLGPVALVGRCWPWMGGLDNCAEYPPGTRWRHRNPPKLGCEAHSIPADTTPRPGSVPRRIWAWRDRDSIGDESLLRPRPSGCRHPQRRAGDRVAVGYRCRWLSAALESSAPRAPPSSSRIAAREADRSPRIPSIVRGIRTLPLGRLRRGQQATSFVRSW